MEAVEKVAAMLEKSKGKDGYTFMDHLAEMIDRIMANPKEYPLDKFEELSYIIKLTRLRPANSNAASVSTRACAIPAWLQRYLTHLAVFQFFNSTFLRSFKTKNRRGFQVLFRSR